MKSAASLVKPSRGSIKFEESEITGTPANKIIHRGVSSDEARHARMDM
ncbi:MAG: hypothetical protein LBS75_03045 [Synergistaceae bacterium]|jgi:ABC-type branched-subunit amino acid transport system ATPase component|nr:hypothetical protein [Synergistaceae bacterium]